MSQDVLFNFAKLRGEGAAAPGLGHNRGPAELPLAILLAFTAAFAVLLLALTAPALPTAAFPILFVICLVVFAGYFGGLLASPIRCRARRQRGAPVATGSGLLSAREAAWQILLLPTLMAGFGLFAAVAKGAIF